MEWHKLNRETVQQELSELERLVWYAQKKGKGFRQGEEAFE